MLSQPITLSAQWTEFLGIEQIGDPYTCAYAVSGQPNNSTLPAAMILNIDLRRVIPRGGAEILYYNSPSPGSGNWVPEAFPLLEKGDLPILFSVDKAKGRISYFSGSFGTMMWNNDLPDYRDILEQLVFGQLKSRRIIDPNVPETVNITAYRSGTKTIIHLVNGSGSIPLDEPVPVGPIHIKLNEINPSKCRWLAPGKETEELDIQLNQQQGILGITIEQLSDYGLVILD